MDQNAKKKQVGEAAARLIEQRVSKDACVGVGTGSTADCFIDALAEFRVEFDCAVASSEATATRLRGHGIRVEELNNVGAMEFYVDGADEIDASFAMIKGGGGALTREKIVASVAETFVCIADESKLVDQLGRYPLPVEVIPMARSAVARAIVELGGRPVYRSGFETDNGNVILDVHELEISDAIAMERALNNLPGVVTNGLFAIRPADLLIVSSDDGVVEKQR